MQTFFSYVDVNKTTISKVNSEDFRCIASDVNNSSALFVFTVAFHVQQTIKSIVDVYEYFNAVW